MILDQMGETHTDGIPVKFLYCSISISAHECYNFILEGLIDQVIQFSQMCIIKYNITALLFYKGPECWGGV